ncbi:oligosaccharide repeat unit polymerase [Candidatus Woesebacteria bacterium]|nr:MAG: oligosaccharide repeat unit polymerase [Candidatus Woesebacteria bacterium]
MQKKTDKIRINIPGTYKVADVAFFIIGLLIPVIIVFYPLIIHTDLSWGDAPNFTNREFTDLFSEPYSWINRDGNLGTIDPRLFIKPILMLYGIMGKYLGLPNNIIINLLFFFPAIILSLIGPIYLAKKLKYPPLVWFFASLFYTLNTYFILLIDGGQVGVALSYGIFPFTILTLTNVISKLSPKKYFLALFVLTLNTIADPRIALIALFVALLVGFIEAPGKWRLIIKNLLLIVLPWICINSYWIIPLVKIHPENSASFVTNLNFISFVNGIFFYQPHWYKNIFGEITYPAWYFLLIPVTVFGNLFSSKDKRELKIILILLFLIFLLKGATPPMGNIYSFAVTNLPFGESFRDNSKFFVPVMLLAGISMGSFLTTICDKLSKHTLLGKSITLFAYIYLLFLVAPAMLGNMNFVLSIRNYPDELSEINTILSEDHEYYRSLWFPDKHPSTFETENNPALNASDMPNLRPLANLTVGSSDKYNYIYQTDKYIAWYRLLGIKYLVLSKDHRNPYKLNGEEQKDWNRLQMALNNNTELKKERDSNDISFYKIDNSVPRIFKADELLAVVGPEIETEFGDDGLPNKINAYFEDGLWNPLLLDKIASESATIIFNGTNEDDFTMTFLQKDYVDPKKFASEWAYFNNDKYLDFKYQLLIRGIKTKTFDYRLGSFLSEKIGEKIVVNFGEVQDASYILAIRSLGGMDSKLRYEIGNEQGEIVSEAFNKDSGETQFRWFTQGIKLFDGDNKLTITNLGGINSVNTVALITADEWNKAKNHSSTYMAHFGVRVYADDTNDKPPASSNLEFEKKNPTVYELSPQKENGWIVFTDAFHPGWRITYLQSTSLSIPAYSMVNAFYIKPSNSPYKLEFGPQVYVRWGLYYTTLSLVVIAIVALWFSPEKKVQHDNKN